MCYSGTATDQGAAEIAVGAHTRAAGDIEGLVVDSKFVDLETGFAGLDACLVIDFVVALTALAASLLVQGQDYFAEKLLASLCCLSADLVRRMGCPGLD